MQRLSHSYPTLWELLYALSDKTKTREEFERYVAEKFNESFKNFYGAPGL